MQRRLLNAVVLAACCWTLTGHAQDPAPTNNSAMSTARLDVSHAGNEPWMANLDELLRVGNFADARTLLFTPGISSIAAAERLKPWAEANNTPAMWLLAERLWYAQRFQESANWIYTADLGTRMDASVCTDSSAIGIEQTIVHAFAQPVQSARQDPLVMRDAIVFALKFQQDHLSHPGNPRWACIVAAPPNRDKRVPLTIDEGLWPRHRQFQIDSFKLRSSR